MFTLRSGEFDAEEIELEKSRTDGQDQAAPKSALSLSS